MLGAEIQKAPDLTQELWVLTNIHVIVMWAACARDHGFRERFVNNGQNGLDPASVFAGSGINFNNIILVHKKWDGHFKASCNFCRL